MNILYINLVENPTPFDLTTPRKVPCHCYQKQEADEPTDWCAPMVVVPKPSAEVRICVHLIKLNAKLRER